MDFPSIGVKTAATHRYQQLHHYQLQNLFKADTLDNLVVNLIFAFKSGTASDFGLDQIRSERP